MKNQFWLGLVFGFAMSVLLISFGIPSLSAKWWAIMAVATLWSSVSAALEGVGGNPEAMADATKRE